MENRRVPVKSVQKALMLLDRIALGDLTRRGVLLADLAQETGLPVNTTHNLLKTLVSSGYVTVQSRGVYSAGPKCTQIGRVSQCANPRIQQRLLAALQRFVDTEGESCVCVLLVNGERVIVGAVDSTHAIRVVNSTVEKAPFFVKATGRMLAAVATEAELEQILERQGWPGDCWDGITDATALSRALATIRETGWCQAQDHHGELVGLAVPVPERNGRTWGVLGTFAPAFRCPAERIEEMIPRLQQIAADFSSIVMPS